MPDQARQLALGVGSLRAAAGAVLLLFPRVATGGDRPARLLARTIGVRDIVLGAGQAWASTQDTATRVAWMRAGTVSDTADAALAIASRRDIGALKSVAAAGLAVPFIGAGIVHEVQSRTS